ncbi:MAG: hypothetical protein GY842_10705 [bacterium]|nr:hypothetical protein [bacterium]
MSQASTRSVLLGVFICVSVALAGCGPGGGGAAGDVEDLCDGIECGPNEQCDDDTGQCTPTDDQAEGEDDGAGEGEDEGEDEGESECTGEDCDQLTGGEPILRDFELPVPLFAADSAWNQRADEAEVLPESNGQILVLYRVLLGDSRTIYPEEYGLNFPFMSINYDAWSYPVFRAGAGQQEVLIRDYEGALSWPGPKFDDADLGGPITIPAPVGTVRAAGPADVFSDGHLVLYDVENGVEYDFWQATTTLDEAGNSPGGAQPGTSILEAGAADFFDVTGPGVNPEGVSSARASGPPLLSGILLPEDVERGAFEHALALAIPGPRNVSDDPSEPLETDYFYPTSTTETDYYNTDPLALASGQRIRLKSSIVDEEGNPIDESELAPITRMFIAALRNYGAYPIDAAGGFVFYAEDIHTANLRLSDDEINELIGEAAGSPLPAGKTKWQIVIEKLNEESELGVIPLASGPWWEYAPGGLDPATATYGVANFEVIENALEPEE